MACYWAPLVRALHQYPLRSGLEWQNAGKPQFFQAFFFATA